MYALQFHFGNLNVTLLNGVPVRWNQWDWHNWGGGWNHSIDEKVPEFHVIYWWRDYRFIGGCNCWSCRGGRAVEKASYRGSKENTAWKKEIWQHR